MTDQEMSARLETLENRLTHQEAAVDELTGVVLAQEKLIRAQKEAIEQLQLYLKDASSSNISAAQERPPHY